MGDLEGLFACTQEDYDKAQGKSAWLDEPLGKHSEYNIKVGRNVKILAVSADVVDILVEAIGRSDISGFNIVSIALEQFEETEFEETEDEDDEDE
jgi:hypothetical protein